MKTHKERQTAKARSGKQTTKTKKKRDVIFELITPERQEQELREARTRRATSIPQKPTKEEAIRRIEKDTIRMLKMRAIMRTQEKENTAKIIRKLQRVKEWLKDENQEKREADQQTARILKSGYFDGYSRNEQTKYITFDTTDAGEGYSIVANRGEGRNSRSYWIETKTILQTISGTATFFDLCDLMRTLHKDKRNDYPTHFFIRWLGFSEKAIRQYIRKCGREIVFKNSPRNYSKYGISTYYAIRPRQKGEETHPYIIEEEISTPFIAFLRDIRARNADKKAGRRRKERGTDEYHDIDF